MLVRTIGLLLLIGLAWLLYAGTIGRCRSLRADLLRSFEDGRHAGSTQWVRNQVESCDIAAYYTLRARWSGPADGSQKLIFERDGQVAGYAVRRPDGSWWCKFW